MTTASRFTCLLVVGFAVLAAPGCKSKLTKENYDKIKVDMTLEQVQKILGDGTREGGGSIDAVGGGHAVSVGKGSSAETYSWTEGQRKIMIHFVNGKVKKIDPAQGL